jgi:asparagine synthase (glutamine-hydrolysing)
MYLPGDLLVKADRMTMAHSLEARSPFLDQELVSWVARLPQRAKLSGTVHKVLLKKACGELLPETIRRRGKQGFGIPVGAWIRGPLRAWVRERLLDPGARILGFFRPESVERLLSEHDGGRVNHGNRIWALLMLELWMRRYA